METEVQFIPVVCEHHPDGAAYVVVPVKGSGQAWVLCVFCDLEADPDQVGFTRRSLDREIDRARWSEALRHGGIAPWELGR